MTTANFRRRKTVSVKQARRRAPAQLAMVRAGYLAFPRYSPAYETAPPSLQRAYETGRFLAIHLETTHGRRIAWPAGTTLPRALEEPLKTALVTLEPARYRAPAPGETGEVTAPEIY